MKQICKIFGWGRPLAAAILLLGVFSCSKDDASPDDGPQDYTVSPSDRIAITFGVRASELNAYRESSEFLQKVYTFREAEAEQLEKAIGTARFIFIYVDATHATDEERADFVEHFRSLWQHVLRDKKEQVLFALRIGDYAPITERLLGFDVGAGLYFFSGKPNSVVYVDKVDTPVADLGVEVMKDFVFRDFSESRTAISGENLPKECVKTVYRSLQFHYERPSLLEWNDETGIAGTFHEGLPASAEVESRSAVVDVDLEFEVYSAVGCEERWISCTAQGAGYKTNLLTRTGYRGDKKGMVLSKTVHTGDAYIANLLRKYTLSMTVAADDLELSEFLPQNVIKETNISDTRSHGIRLEGSGGGGGEGGHGEGAGEYNFTWSKTVEYTQPDFEMHCVPTEMKGSRKVSWQTIPAQLFREPAWRGNFGTSEIDTRLLSKRQIAAGRTPAVFEDFNSPDFPMGFHTMTPAASALFRTTSDDVTVTVEAALELQDSKQYWCAGVRNNPHDYFVKTASNKLTMGIRFSDDVIFY